VRLVTVTDTADAPADTDPGDDQSGSPVCGAVTYWTV